MKVLLTTVDREDFNFPVAPKVLAVSLLAFTSLPLMGALEATIATNRGNIKVTLEYTKAPRAVGSFISLAEGTRPWIDPRNGELKKKPYYNGILFHRVVNDSGFKIIQAGSPIGDGTDGPGYEFPDEFHATLPVAPYVMAMANSGRNTNGSQIFFTGNVGASWLTNVHTVFGTVTEPASRSVIDAILSAGAGTPPASPTTISGVLITRTDPAAQAFDPLAQNLPTPSAPPYSLTDINPTVGTGEISINQAPGSMLRLYQTLDLSSWSTPGYIYRGHDEPALTKVNIDSIVTGIPKQFFRSPVTLYPQDAAPGTMNGRTLVVQTTLFGQLSVVFNNQGGGVVVHSSGSYPIIGYDHSPAPYNATLVIEAANIVPLRFRLAYDSVNSTHRTGRATAEYYNGLWNDALGSSFTLTK